VLVNLFQILAQHLRCDVRSKRLQTHQAAVGCERRASLHSDLLD
jgi:hypothetical protein